MLDNNSSVTAHRVAFRRAAHQVLDNPPVFLDPLALKILGPATLSKIQRHTEDLQQPISRALRAFVSARSAFAEECLKRSVLKGVKQYVLLGAGFDTFAYRNPYPEVQVFEVDHPATQQRKREMLKDAEITISASTTYVAVDFEKEDLQTRLQDSGFDLQQPAFFSWLGVTQYLTLPAFRKTVMFIGALPNGSGIAFDYTLSPQEMNDKQRKAFDTIAERVASAGEPFQLFFAPEAIQSELQQAGFNAIEDLAHSGIQERYFAGRTDGLHAGSISRLVCGRKL